MIYRRDASCLLYTSHPMSTKELARQSFLPIPVVTAMKKEFIKLGVLEQKNGIEITELGRRYIEEALGFGGLDLDLYQNLIEDREWEERLSLIHILPSILIKILPPAMMSPW